MDDKNMFIPYWAEIKSVNPGYGAKIQFYTEDWQWFGRVIINIINNVFCLGVYESFDESYFIIECDD
jgi:hypothetical protein